MASRFTPQATGALTPFRPNGLISAGKATPAYGSATALQEQIAMWYEKWMIYRSKRRTIRMLESLPHHILHDIGWPGPDQSERQFLRRTRCE